MIPYGRQDITDEDIAEVEKVLRSDYLTQGPTVPKFEQSVIEYCSVKYAVAVNSATSALHIACLSLDQDDTDQEFIKFDGTTATDQSASLTTDTTVGAITGHIRVNVNGTDFWIPYYATN